MYTSARNQFEGTVTAIKNGAVNSEVQITLANGQIIVAAITCESVAQLNLQQGSEVMALVKAGNVILATDLAEYTFSTRNQLTGKISHIEKGAVNAIVTLDMGNNVEVNAGITLKSSENLHLTVGQSATALFKANSVVLAVKK